MTTLKIVVNNDCKKETSEALLGYDYLNATGTFKFNKEINALFYNVDSTKFTAAREANKIAHDYAVTEFPFVLLVNEDGDEYAACYSEEGPITIERINDKL